MRRKWREVKGAQKEQLKEAGGGCRLSAVGVMKKGKVRGQTITHGKRGGSGTKGKMRGTDSEGSIGQLMDWLFPSELWRVNRLSFA